ncbi:glycerate kinase, partial [Microbacterium maritypicum]|uniref:glycerate kinase n=1 Tax=Microbacterium maritypicum TaxID=33918 RepID=UPI003D6F5C82
VLVDSGLLPEPLDELMAVADLVITAEGAIDFQTPRGKVPAEIAMRARVAGVPVLGIAGSLGVGAPTVHDIGIDAIASIITIPMPLEQAVENGEALLRDAAERSMRMVLLGSAMSARAA